MTTRKRRRRLRRRDHTETNNSKSCSGLRTLFGLTLGSLGCLDAGWWGDWDSRFLVVRPTGRRRRILVLVADYKPPDARLQDVLLQYQEDFAQFEVDAAAVPRFDFFFLCTDNFQLNRPQTRSNTLRCAQAAAANNNNNTIPYLILDPIVARPVLQACAYCQGTKPWGWSAFMAPLLALQQLEQMKNETYDAVWVTDPDAELVGANVAEWLARQEEQELPPLVSSLIMPSVEMAREHLQPGMYSRIQSTWVRWNESLGSIDFGVFTYVTRYSREMLQAVQTHLAEATFVETFLPYCCRMQFGSECHAASLLFNDVGFLNNAGNVFAGEQSAENFAQLAAQQADRLWYHPTKFSQSWRMSRNTSSTSSAITPEGKLNGMCVNMACLMPRCSDIKTDDCIYVQPN